jgi:peptide/nickel transport system ATP-binding protein
LKSIGGNPPSLLALPPGCAFAPRCRHRFHPCGQRPELSGGNGHLAACFIPPAEREAARAGRITAPVGAS